MAGRTLEQTHAWDPTDLSRTAPKRRRAHDEGPGILPDTDSRPNLQAVARPTSQPNAPAPPRQAPAPWER